MFLGNPTAPVYVPPQQLAIGSNTVTQSYYGIQTTAVETTFWNDIKTNLNVRSNCFFELKLISFMNFLCIIMLMKSIAFQRSECRLDTLENLTRSI